MICTAKRTILPQMSKETEEAESPTFGGTDRTGNSLVHEVPAEISYEACRGTKVAPDLRTAATVIVAAQSSGDFI